MSLLLGRAPDMNHQRVLARHRERTEHLKVPVDIREKQRRQYQALLEGRGGKVCMRTSSRTGRLKSAA